MLVEKSGDVIIIPEMKYDDSVLISDAKLPIKVER